MAIVPATLEDIPALVDLVETCYRGEDSRKGWTTEVDMVGGTRITPEMMKDEMTKPGSVMLKYVDDSGKLIGCASTEKQPDRLFTGMLCVKPDLQAAGLGRKLMTAVEDMARENNLENVGIRVISIRTELIQWYERRGFKRTGKVIPFPSRAGFAEPKLPIELIEMHKNIKESV